MGGISALYVIIYVMLVTLHRCTSSEGTLKFLFLGDWGKGGNSGYYATRISGDEVDSSGMDDDKRPLNYNGTYKKDEFLGSHRRIEGPIDRKLQNNKVTYQAAVAKAMGGYANDFQPSFVVALGDNFYTNGVSSSTDAYWDYLWTNVYLDYYAALRIPWYPVFGNHDYGYGAQGVQAQIDRSQIDDYWSMKSTNYSRQFNIPNGGSVIIVFIDTTTLAPSVNRCCNENGGISAATQAIRIQNQLDHIDAMLTEANQKNPTWLLVAGHYPVFSLGEHGDTSELKTYLWPRLNTYGVHAYFCGHDHFSEHLVSEEVHYFVAGGGSMTDYLGATTSAATGIWAGEGYSAFASAAATKEELVISFIDTDGKTKYTKTLNNPRPGESPTQRPTEPPARPKTVDVTKKIVIISSGFAALAFLLIAGGFYYESKGKKKKKKPKKWSKGFMSYTLPGASFAKSFKKSSKPKNSLRALATTRSPRNVEEAMDLVTNKKDLTVAEANDEDVRDAGDFSQAHGQQNRNMVLGTNTSGEAVAPFIAPSVKRFNAEFSSNSRINNVNSDLTHNNNMTDDGVSNSKSRRGHASHPVPMWDEETATARAQTLPHTIITHLTSSTPIGVQRSKDGRIFEAIPDVTNEHHKRARTSIF